MAKWLQMETGCAAIRCGCKSTAGTEDQDATALFVPLGLTFHVRVTDLEVDDIIQEHRTSRRRDDILPERLDER